jgi:hypothetical protein
MGLMFNRFVEVRFVTAGKAIGGRQELVNSRIQLPPSIGFDVRHSTDSTPNDAKITIYNLSAETQKDLFREGDKIELEAGYWPVNEPRETGSIFRGQIRKAMSRNESGIETITEIECGDGDHAFAHARVRKNVGKATHKIITQVIVDEFKKAGIKAVHRWRPQPEVGG